MKNGQCKSSCFAGASLGNSEQVSPGKQFGYGPGLNWSRGTIVFCSQCFQQRAAQTEVRKRGQYDTFSRNCFTGAIHVRASHGSGMENGLEGALNLPRDRNVSVNSPAKAKPSFHARPNFGNSGVTVIWASRPHLSKRIWPIVDKELALPVPPR